MEHFIEPSLLTKRVSIHLVGVGGNGAQMATRLARLDEAIRANGHPGGLHVTAFDRGVVREANIGRQAFSRSDIGMYKSVITIDRLNDFFGLDWNGYPWTIQEAWSKRTLTLLPDILISCVDTRAARRDLHHYMIDHKFRGYWLDLGNDQNSGQVVLGQPGEGWYHAAPNRYRLPTVADLYPELLDESIPDTNVPSCSIPISLASQGLYVNDFVTTYAAHLLYTLFDKGKLQYHGVQFNLDEAVTVPFDVDPAMWRRYGVPLPDDAEQPAALAA